MQSALDQAMVENNAAAEQRAREVHEMQQMVATGDGLSLGLGIVLVLALIGAATYIPAILSGDYSGTSVLMILFVIVAILLVFILIRRMRS